MRSPRGATLLIAILLCGYSYICSRAVLHDGGPPAFFVEKRDGIPVVLGEGFPAPGLYQFSDGISLEGVIQMTELRMAPALMDDPRLSLPLRPGEFVNITIEGSQVIELQRNWLPASQRMVLGVALHPDRMNLDDWQALSGIGPKLAQRIEEDRQQSGDFGSLEGLKRVRGIGPRRIENWRKFF